MARTVLLQASSHVPLQQHVDIHRFELIPDTHEDG